MRVVLGVALIALWIYCVVDVLQSEPAKVRHLPKLAWGVLVVLFGAFGGIAWLIAGRPQRTSGGAAGMFRGRELQQPRLAPDDDPDFLRSLRITKPPVDGEPPTAAP